MITLLVFLLVGILLGALITRVFLKPEEIIVEVPVEKKVIVVDVPKTFIVNNENHEFGSAKEYIGFDLRVNKDKHPTRMMATHHEFKIMRNRAIKNRDEKQPE